MKGKPTFLQLAAFVVGLVIAAGANAQHEASDVDEPRAETTDESRLQPSEPDEDSTDVGRQVQASSGKARYSEEASRRYLVQLRKLQEAMKENLGLSRAQTEAVDQLFRNYLHGLKEDRGRRRPSGSNPNDVEKLKDLRARLREARKAGDNETVQELRGEFRRMRQTGGSAAALPASQFIKKIEAELDEDQRPGFQSLLKRLRIGASADEDRGGLQRLRRAVMSPGLGLTDEQRRTIQAIFRKGLVSTAQAARASAEGAEITTQVRADVLKVLTPEQRTKMETMLRAGADRSRGLRRPGATHPPRPTKRPDDDEAEESADQPQETSDETEPDEAGNAP